MKMHILFGFLGLPACTSQLVLGRPSSLSYTPWIFCRTMAFLAHPHTVPNPVTPCWFGPIKIMSCLFLVSLNYASVPVYFERVFCFVRRVPFSDDYRFWAPGLGAKCGCFHTLLALFKLSKHCSSSMPPFFLIKTGLTCTYVCVCVFIVFLEGLSFDG